MGKIEDEEYWNEQDHAKSMRIIEEYKLDCYKGKLNLGFNSLTNGGDFRSL